MKQKSIPLTFMRISKIMRLEKAVNLSTVKNLAVHRWEDIIIWFHVKVDKIVVKNKKVSYIVVIAKKFMSQFNNSVMTNTCVKLSGNIINGNLPIQKI